MEGIKGIQNSINLAELSIDKIVKQQELFLIDLNNKINFTTGEDKMKLQKFKVDFTKIMNKAKNNDLSYIQDIENLQQQYKN